ncbi:MAG: RHS repeat protein, partial [Verrucomicrobia bacterium]|nr:RHS repeat protein [Verrucomicrobiota bacterium]
MDAFGHITTISYKEAPFEGQTVLLTTTIDPLQRQTLSYQDGKGRLLREEQRDAQGKLLSQVDRFYDLNGNEVKQEHQVLIHGKVLRTYAFGNTFSPSNQLLQSTEGLTSELPRITRYVYDASSRLQLVIKPDGAHIYRTYDDLGRLATQKGPDFSYTYTYDEGDNLIAVNDVYRSYDAQNCLIEETTPAGRITYQRDRLGRRTHLSYLGQEVSYTYRGPYIATASSRNLTHHYLEYDLEGRPVLEQLPGKCGSRKKQYDRLGRLTHLETDYLVQDLAYDSVSNLTSLKTNSLHFSRSSMDYAWEEKEEHFSYDSLNQLTSEPEMTYKHDSIGNRLSYNDEFYDYDGLNQRLQDLYDLSGRLTQVGPHKCSHDSLDRLIHLDDKEFSYDSFHRRQDLLYDEQMELGDANAFRILGRAPFRDIGAMVLVVLQGDSYIPITDHHGSVVALVTPQGQLCERYLYTAFGIPQEESIYGNPWGYC